MNPSRNVKEAPPGAPTRNHTKLQRKPKKNNLSISNLPLRCTPQVPLQHGAAQPSEVEVGAAVEAAVAVEIWIEI